MVHLTRKQFLDRPMTTAELRALGEMWRGWSGIPHGTRPGGWGKYRLACRISGFARQDADAFRADVSAHVADFGGRLERYDEDTVEVVGPDLPASQPFDVGLWAELISAPACAGMCLMLRLRVRGTPDVATGSGTPQSTLVLFGQSLGARFLAKALWVATSGDETESIYHRTDWPSERRFLNAFEVFRHVESLPPALPGCPVSFRCSDAYEASLTVAALRALAGPSVPLGDDGFMVWAEAPTVACAQAASHTRFFRSTKNPLFLTPREARLAVWMTRMWVELPRDRTPGRFAVRLGIPLAVCGALTWAIFASDPQDVVLRGTLAVPAFAALCLAVRIAVKKVQLIRRVHARMHAALSKLYAHSSSHEPADLCALGLGDDPSVAKYTSDMAAIGGEHVGDFRIVAEGAPRNGFRMYRLPSEHTVMVVIFMNRTNNLHFFPARPLLACKTHFRDGHRHSSSSGRGDRKLRRPNVSHTCVRNGNPDEILAVHRAAVRKLIAAGHEPLEPPRDAAALLALDKQESEEARAFYRARSPYSYGDAVYWAFDVMRREYRPVIPLRARRQSDEEEE